jgi:hypothetical protein
MLLKNRWNIWNTRLQHVCEIIATYVISRSTFGTSMWNTCNTPLKHLKHLKHTIATCAFSAMSPGCLDEWRPRRCGAWRRCGGQRRRMELAGAPAEALCHPGRVERPVWAPGKAASTLGEHGSLGKHLHEAAKTLVSGELGSLLDEHLGEHPAGRAPLGREIFFKEARTRASGRRRSEWEATSVHLDVLDRALSFNF